MNDKYSKSKLIGKKWFVFLITILAILLILSIAFIVYIHFKNVITYEKINSSSLVTDNIAASSTPIVVNNIIVGAVYDKKWVSTERYFFKSTNKEKFDVDVFNKEGKAGSFKLNEIQKNNEQATAYTSTTRINHVDEYYAIKTGSSFVKMSLLELNNETNNKYINYVKEALGMYNMLNGTVKIKEIYETYLTPGKVSYVITATNNSNSNGGVYSAVVFVDNDDKVSLVKYNFLKDVNNSSDFNIYSVKFIADLNDDGVSEIILQETKEFDTKYSIMEYNKGKFYEVLSAKLSNKII